MPRIVTPEYRKHLDDRANLHDAAVEFDRDKRDLLDSTLRKWGLPVASRSDGDYRNDPEGPSWYLDRAWASGSDVLRDHMPPPTVQGAGEARKRLEGIEQRDLTTTVTAGGNFVPSGSPPSYIAEMFATAARPRAVLANALAARPIPPSGMKISTPRINAAATVAIQTDGGAVSEGSASTAIVESDVGTIAGMVDASAQLFDRSDPSIDEVISAELGAAWGAALDLELVTRLLALSGTTSTTATTATAVANIAVSGKMTADTATAAGAKPDLLVMHPRRFAFVATTLGYSPAPWPIDRVLEAPGVPLTIGGTQDVMLALVADQVIPFVSRPVITVLPEVGSGTLTVRVSVYSYLALVVRQPTGVGKATGAGLAAPSWTV